MSEARRLGHYAIERELGRGGMGVVYRAQDTKLGRAVALKTISGLADDEAIERFVREARAVARLDHPGIVRVHEAGRVDGICYAALELVEGGSLEKRLATSGPLAPREAATVARDLALAVQYAHEVGIVHRDLKPANVLVGADGKPRLTDFGLARVEGATQLTETGTAMGTPGYMSPEQASADAAAIGPASDVYGLGAVLFALVTGRPPFQGGTGLAVMHKVLHDEVASPSAIRVRGTLPPLHRDLETICLKALAKKPADRYASAAHLAADLGRFLEGEPIAARPPGLADRTLRFVRRRRVVTYSVLAGGLLTTLALGGTWAREALHRKRLAAEFADHLARGEAAMKARRSEEAVACFGSALALEPACVEARLGRALAASELSSRNLNRISLDTAKRWVDIAHKEATELLLLRPAWRTTFERLETPMPGELVEVLPRLGRKPGHVALLQLEVYPPEDAAGAADVLKQLVARALELSPDVPELNAYAAALVLDLGEPTPEQLERAATCAERAVRLDPGRLRLVALRARVRERRGDHAGALADATAATRADPDDPYAWTTRAAALAGGGDGTGALGDLAKAVAAAGGDTIAALVATALRVQVLQSLNDRARDPDLLRDLDFLVANETKVSEDWLHFRMLRAEVHARNGRFEAARDDLDQVLRLQPRFGLALRLRALVHEELGDRKAALADLRSCANDPDPRIADQARGLLEKYDR